MNDVFQCDCGIRTREPFFVKGTKMCAVCAEQVAPALVMSKAHQWLEAGRRKPVPWRHRVWK